MTPSAWFPSRFPARTTLPGNRSDAGRPARPAPVRPFRSLVLCGAVAAFGLLGCFEDEQGPTETERETSRLSASAGTDSLEELVGEMVELESFEYYKGNGEAKIRGAHNGYEAAIAKDPGNNEAKLGSAITGILVALQSQSMKNLMEEVTESQSLFDEDIAQGAPAARGRVLAKVAALRDFPEFHAIQDTLGKVLLPALEKSIARVTDVHKDKNFRLEVELDREDYELDHAEVSVFLASLKAVHGILTLYLSYDIDIDRNGDYSFIDDLETLEDLEDFSALNDRQEAALQHVVKVLDPNSPFLAVRPSWKGRLNQVDEEIFSAVSILRDGLASIESEKDDQGDDILRVCDEFSSSSSCIDSESYENALQSLDSARKYMKQHYKIALPKGLGSLSVDFAAFLRVQDYKKMLPHYGFYPPREWSETKPVLYFTNAQGKVTGDINELQRIDSLADKENWTPMVIISEVQAVVKLRDPTFQGLFPGLTEERFWRIIQTSMEEDWGVVDYDDEEDLLSLEKKQSGSKAVQGSSTSARSIAYQVMSPDFFWRLLALK